jgi:hypothetical protein
MAKTPTSGNKEETMKVGMLLAMPNHPDSYQADHNLYWDGYRLADLAEPSEFVERSMRHFAAEVLPELKRREKQVSVAEDVHAHH